MLTICQYTDWDDRWIKVTISFHKISKPTDRDGVYHLQFDLRNCFRLSGDWELENLVTGKEKNSAVPFQPEQRELQLYLKTLSRIPNWSSGKLLFHLTFNRNTRIFCLVDKYPMSSSVAKTPENAVAFVIGNFRKFKPDFFIEWEVPSIYWYNYKRCTAHETSLTK